MTHPNLNSATKAKYIIFTGKNNGTASRISIKFSKSINELYNQCAIERVECFWTIESNDCDLLLRSASAAHNEERKTIIFRTFPRVSVKILAYGVVDKYLTLEIKLRPALAELVQLDDPYERAIFFKPELPIFYLQLYIDRSDHRNQFVPCATNKASILSRQRGCFLASSVFTVTTWPLVMNRPYHKMI